MRVFISGIAGFLGSHLADAFLAAGHQVAGCDNLLSGDRDNLPDGVEFKQADCADVDAMRRLTDGAEVVYHCAALATEGASVFAPALVTYHCYQTTAALVSASAANRVRRFVLCSSMARYGAGPTPFVEDQACRPEDPYGIAKYASELLVANVCGTHGMEHVIALPHNIYGPRQRYDDPYRNVAGIMMNRMLLGKQPVIYGDGGQERSFSYVADCVAPLFRMAETDCISGEAFNIGPDDEPITVLELARLIAGILSFRLDPVFVPARVREVRNATCSAEKARKHLQYRTTTSLRDGLKLMAEWVKSRGPRPFRYFLPFEIDSDLGPETWKRRTL